MSFMLLSLLLYQSLPEALAHTLRGGQNTPITTIHVVTWARSCAAPKCQAGHCRCHRLQQCQGWVPRTRSWP